MRRDADVPRSGEEVLGDAVVEHALAVIVPFFWALNAVASSLKYWIRVPGSGPS